MFTAYAQKLPINAHAVISTLARGLNIGQGLHLHPYFIYAHSEGSGEYVHLSRPAGVITTRR